MTKGYYNKEKLFLYYSTPCYDRSGLLSGGYNHSKG